MPVTMRLRAAPQALGDGFSGRSQQERESSPSGDKEILGSKALTIYNRYVMIPEERKGRNMYRLTLGRACRNSGMTLTELSRRTGIPQPSLSRYAAGRSDITLRQMSRITLALGCDIEDLVEQDSLLSTCAAEIRERENAPGDNDKSWVTSVVVDLTRHYRSV